MKIFKTDQIGQLGSRDRLTVYNGFDTLITREIYDKINEKLDADTKPSADFSQKLLGPVMSMMRRGLPMDDEERKRLIVNRTDRMEKLKAHINLLANIVWGKDLNIQSPLQMMNFFHLELWLPKQMRAEKGEVKAKLDRKALEYLRDHYVRAKPFVNAILRYKDLKAELDLFKKELVGGRLLYSFNIGGTDTFRYSSSEHPYRYGRNVQNIDPALRYLFKADPGYVMFSCDLKGADAMVVAYKCGDENYIEVQKSSDGHTKVASMTWGFEEKRELADREFYNGFSYRDMCKKLAHGSNYNGSSKTLATQTTLPMRMAEEFQTKYFTAFPGIREWQQWVAREIQTKGYLISATGRKRTFWDRRWDDSTVRQALAYEPQNVVGDICHIQEYLIWKHFEPHVQLLVNGHDAVVFQVKSSDVDKLMPDVLQLLKVEIPVTDINGITRTMLIESDVKAGLNWGDSSPTNPEGLKKWSLA